MAPASADPSKLRRSDMPPHRGLKPPGTLGRYHQAAPTALDPRASRDKRVGARVGSNIRFMGRGEGDRLPPSLVLSCIPPTCQQRVTVFPCWRHWRLEFGSRGLWRITPSLPGSIRVRWAIGWSS